MSEAPAADYAISILETLSQAPGLMGISDISRETGINKNAVSRVLGSLTASGWVFQDGVKYQLTLKPFRVASAALGRTTFYSAAQPVLTRLWEETGESCYIGILKNDAVLYLGHIDSTRDLKIAGRVGGSYPLANTAPGRVLLAYADEAYRARYMREHLGYSEAECGRMEEKLAAVRAEGRATDVEEYGPGIICVAAPVFDMSGQVVGTIGVSTSTVYCTEQELLANQGQKVIAAAREISEKLGAQPQ
ncbi:MAG: IclR family transcriptional regulator [Ruminococcaceae bacterium]|nr:IclR family transcriptional regulator [Oscillospiraceae bacterium]